MDYRAKKNIYLLHLNLPADIGQYRQLAAAIAAVSHCSLGGHTFLVYLESAREFYDALLKVRPPDSTVVLSGIAEPFFSDRAYTTRSDVAQWMREHEL